MASEKEMGRETGGKLGKEKMRVREMKDKREGERGGTSCESLRFSPGILALR
jgi:hypothetical protein